MTACTNHGGKARRVVTAALVGVLSVGTVPMVALATGADTTDGIETMAVGWNTKVTVVSATDGKGGVVSNPNEATFVKGSGKFLLPTAVKNDSATTMVDLNSYKVLIYSNETSAENNDKGANLVAATGAVDESYWGDPSVKMASAGKGTYYVVIEDATDGSYTNPIPFVIAEQGGYEGVTVKSQLVYNGSAQTPKFVDENGKDVTPDGAISYSDALGHTITAASVKDAGDYVATFTADSKPYTVPFSIAKLDLSAATLVVDDAMAGDLKVSADLFNALSINGNASVASSLFTNDEIQVTKVVSPNGSAVLNSGAGSYEVTIAGTSSSQKNITGAGVVKFAVINDDLFVAPGAVATLNYGNETVPASGTISVNLLDGESYDGSKFKVTYDEVVYSGDALELSYEVNKGTAGAPDWKACDAADLAKQGQYRVRVRVKPFSVFGGSTVYGGSTYITVNVNGASINADRNLAFYFDGELSGNGTSVSYDGTDQLEKLDVVLKDNDGNELVEGTDYELEVTDAKGEAVDSVVNANGGTTYTVTVKPLTFTFAAGSTNTFAITVNPVQLTRLVADVTDMRFEAGDNGYIDPSQQYDGTTLVNQFYVKYTGSAVEVPGVKYQVQQGTGADAKYSYVALDPSLYNVVSVKQGSKTVTEVVEKDTYTVTIALTDEANGNYNMTDTSYDFTVRAYGHFVDVASDKWYAEAVEQAYSQYYINGVGGTELFAPEASISRADVACILFNMAGGTRRFDDFEFNENTGFVTGFDDVDGHAYYAQAIAWAKAFGVVNGHDGNFRPDDKVTREEFATMLANYAKSKGESIATDGSALAALPDASAVSSWAQESVAWAVENKVMGNGGFVGAQSNISRAEVAAMAVNYQPESLDGVSR